MSASQYTRILYVSCISCILRISYMHILTSMFLPWPGSCVLCVLFVPRRLIYSNLTYNSVTGSTAVRFMATYTPSLCDAADPSNKYGCCGQDIKAIFLDVPSSNVVSVTTTPDMRPQITSLGGQVGGTARRASERSPDIRPALLLGLCCDVRTSLLGVPVTVLAGSEHHRQVRRGYSLQHDDYIQGHAVTTDIRSQRAILRHWLQIQIVWWKHAQLSTRMLPKLLHG